MTAEKGDLEIIRRRMIVEDGQVEDPLAQVGYSDAVKIEPDFEVGEELYEEIDLLDFGRRAILAAKQTLASRISDLKKNVLAKKYGDRIGEVISAEVYQVWKKRSSCSMKKETNSCYPRVSRFRRIISRKVKTSVL